MTSFLDEPFRRTLKILPSRVRGGGGGGGGVGHRRDLLVFDPAEVEKNLPDFRQSVSRFFSPSNTKSRFDQFFRKTIFQKGKIGVRENAIDNLYQGGQDSRLSFFLFFIFFFSDTQALSWLD
jgi:hypothetical protein